MSKYVGVVVLETEFEGDRVRAELEPLSRGTFLRVYPKLQELQKLGTGNAESINILETATAVVGEHLIKIEGLKDAANNPVDVQTLLGKIYFSKLVSEIFARLMESSSLGEEKSAN